jgi:hypothetical protein
LITQQEELYRQLEAFGWRKVEGTEVEDRSLDWWAHEVWVLESLWKPQECRIYLTFVKNPHDPPEGPWAVTAALEGPTQQSEVEIILERPGRRKEGLPAFFADLAGLRAAWQAKGSSGQ